MTPDEVGRALMTATRNQLKALIGDVPMHPQHEPGQQLMRFSGAPVRGYTVEVAAPVTEVTMEAWEQQRPMMLRDIPIISFSVLRDPDDKEPT